MKSTFINTTISKKGIEFIISTDSFSEFFVFNTNIKSFNNSRYVEYIRSIYTRTLFIGSSVNFNYSALIIFSEKLSKLKRFKNT